MFVCEDGFVPTRLNPAAFPTAHELNTGDGPRMAERESRFAAKLARTEAFMSKRQERFAALHADSFLHLPDEGEDEFVRLCGEHVPEDYLARLEQALYHIHLMCAIHFTPISGRSAKPPAVLETDGITRCTDVIYFEIGLCRPWKGDPRRVCLNVVYTRPCAESFGFLRVLLYEIARNCLHFDASLCVQSPVAATQAILARAWGPAGNPDLFEVPVAKLQHPALGVEGLLLLPPSPWRVGGAPEQPNTQALVDAFVSAQPRGARFTRVVDAFYDFARDRGGALVRPDVILTKLLLHPDAKFVAGEWVLRPVRKRDKAELPPLDALVEEFLRGFAERRMRVTRTELVAEFRRFLEQSHGVQEPEAFFSPPQILAAFNRIDRDARMSHPASEALKRYTVKREPLYALGRDGERVANPAWNWQEPDLVRAFFEARTQPRRATRRELFADMRAFMAEKDVPQEFYTDRALQHGIEFFETCGQADRLFKKTRIGRTDYYEYGQRPTI